MQNEDQYKYGVEKWTKGPPKPALVAVNEAERLRQDGNEAFRGGDAAAALEKYREAISLLETFAYGRSPNAAQWDPERLDPLRRLLRLNASACYLKQSVWDGASYFASLVLADGVDRDAAGRAKALYRRAQARVGRREYTGAIADLEEALRCGGNTAELRALLADSRRKDAAQHASEQRVYKQMLSGLANANAEEEQKPLTKPDQQPQPQTKPHPTANDKRVAELQGKLAKTVELAGTAAGPDTSLVLQVAQLEGQLDRIECDLHEVLMKQVRCGRLVNLKEVREDLTGWHELSQRPTDSLSLSERVAIAKEVKETRDLLESSATTVEQSGTLRDSLTTMEREYMAMLSELREDATRAVHEGEPGAEALCDRLEKARHRVDAIVGQFRYRAVLEEVQAVLYKLMGATSVPAGTAEHV
eukprot:TRINITY_DN631_c0_g1_i3.p2 TRINITY_DN631_c0_g1~~TRINITY_DN631_c0_g1_i3.p2  ORF type:complete len:441 (+),score=133.16 TRINITY_DN631_c0_g1_i3:74-1324(+)